MRAVVVVDEAVAKDAQRLVPPELERASRGGMAVGFIISTPCTTLDTSRRLKV